MNFKADDLLDHVDEWKFKLQEKLTTLTPEQRIAFWKEIEDQARTAGLPLAELPGTGNHPAHQTPRATG